MEIADELKNAATESGITLGERETELFACYYKLLMDWNVRMNLTAITGARDFSVKHVMDSLLALDGGTFQSGTRVIDIGSGAGFPGLALAIAVPGLDIVLLDSLAKRVTFLSEAVRALGISGVTCIHSRAEEAARGPMREAFDVAIARAVAPLNVLAEYSLPFVKVGGNFIALKGAKYEEELAGAAGAAKLLGGGPAQTKLTALPDGDARAIISIPKLAPTPHAYPRRAGVPSKKPLRA